MRLFADQKAMVGRVCAALQEGGSVLCQMPTGTGKTVVLASAVCRLARRGEVVWVIAHRRELVEQVRRTWETHFAGRRTAPEVRVLSVQWLARHLDEMTVAPSLIVVDEAHHATAPTYRRVIERYPQARLLGMTATPYRLQGECLQGMFGRLLCAAPLDEFILQGRLSLMDYYVVPRDSKVLRLISQLRRRGGDGDFVAGEMAASLNNERHIAHLYDTLMRHARGRRGIVYAIDIAHARAIAAYYAARGLRCRAVDCLMPAAERDACVAAYREGELDVLVNVDIFSEGFDCPETGFIQLARPTLSLSVYLQQVGRGLRRARGKRHCVVLDNVGLAHVFGGPVRRWPWDGLFDGTAADPRVGMPWLRSLARQAPRRGRLADEPMELIVDHRALTDAVERQGVLEYYDDVRPDMPGVRVDGRVAARLRVARVVSVAPGMVVVTTAEAEVVAVFADGRLLKLPAAATDVVAEPDGFVGYTAGGERLHRDVASGRDFAALPRVVRYGVHEFLLEGGCAHMRCGGDFRDFPAEWLGEGCMHGFYMMLRDRLPARDFWYTPLAGGDGTVETVYFSDERCMYLLVKVTGEGVVVASLDGDYMLVTPQLRRRRLFRATSFLDSKSKYMRLFSMQNAECRMQNDNLTN